MNLPTIIALAIILLLLIPAIMYLKKNGTCGSCPDKGACLHYDPNLAASVYLENDLEQLMRGAY